MLNNQVKYPQNGLCGFDRNSKPKYLSDNFVNSTTKDELYCIYCTLFITEDKRKMLASFFNTGYSV